MAFVFGPLAQPSVAVAASNDRLPAMRRTVRVGRNCAAHAGAMGKDPDRDLPVFIGKWITIAQGKQGHRF